MIFVIIAIVILFISFVIALISLIREQKEVAMGAEVEEKSNSTLSEADASEKAGQDNEKQPEIPSSSELRDQLDEHARLRASHLETLFEKSEQASSTSEYEPFYWERDKGEQNEKDTSSSKNSSEPKLSGVISLKDIPEKT